MYVIFRTDCVVLPLVLYSCTCNVMVRIVVVPPFFVRKTHFVRKRQEN